MGRGPVIEAKKNKSSQERGKVFSIHAKLIALAAQRGADPDKNPALAEAVEKARKDNVPNDNIDRAIKKGSGADKDASHIEEIYYEGYAPGGVGVIVRVLTDNKNRTAPNMRHHFSKYGGNLGETGSVSSFAFQFKGVAYIEKSGKSDEELEEIIIESGADDYAPHGEDHLKVVSSKNDLHAVRDYLKDKNVHIDEYGLEYIPNNYIEVTDFDKVLKIYKLIEDIEADEDVETVWHNAQISDDLMKQAEEAVEKAKFRT